MYIAEDYNDLNPDKLCDGTGTPAEPITTTLKIVQSSCPYILPCGKAPCEVGLGCLALKKIEVWGIKNEFEKSV